MPNTQSNHRNKRTANGQGVISASQPIRHRHMHSEHASVIPQGSSLKQKGCKAQSVQGSTWQVSKVVALSKAKSRFTSLGCSFPVGLDWLPVVGGLL